MTTLKSVILAMPGYVDATNPTDAAALTYLNETVTVQGDASSGDVLGWCAATDAIHVFKGHSAGADPVKRGIADAFLMRIASGQGLSLTSQDVKDLLAAAVAADMFGPAPATQNAVDALNATAQTQVARWAEKPLTLNKQKVTGMSIGWVEAAR